MSVRVGAVFPAANTQGGVERVVRDFLAYLADRHPTSFFGRTYEDGRHPRVEFVEVRPRPAVPALRPFAFKHAARTMIRSRPVDRLMSFGVTCPPGDVYWVQSVHRAWLASARGLRVGSLTVSGQLRHLLPRHRMLLELERRYFTRAEPQWIICLSARESEYLQAHYRVDPKRIVVIPNGYDAASFSVARRTELREEARASLGLGETDIAALFVANELHRKGFGESLEAMSRNGDERVSLHVVGRMPLTGYERRIAELGLAGRVRYHGPTADVAWYHAAADFLLLPTQYEPFGLVIIEAMASGLPVVTSRLAGAAAAITHGVDGWLLENPRDVDELAEALKAASDDSMRTKWGERCAQSARPYEWRNIFARAEPLLVGP